MMPRGIFWTLAILGLAARCNGGSSQTASKQHYVVGIWNPAGDPTLLSKYQPIFGDYLTEQVGHLYSPPLDFTLVSVDSNLATSSESMIKAGKVDFVYGSRATLVCLESQFEFSPVVSHRMVVNNVIIGGVGTVFYSLKSNSTFSGTTNITSLRNKKIGMGHIWSLESYQLGFELLLLNGLNLFAEAAEVVFYQTDYQRQMLDVLNGYLDAGFLPAGWFEQRYPDLMPYFDFHAVKSATFEGEVYPFLTSTDLAPGRGLSAGPGVPWLLRQQIYRALSARSGAPWPEAAAVGVARFTLPGSYQYPRTLAKGSGVMTANNVTETCRSPFGDYYDIVVCPDGYLEADRAAVAAGCAGQGCPAGLKCLCRPCVPDVVVDFYEWQVVLGLCCGLFLVGFVFSLCWRIPMETAHLIQGVAKYEALTKGSAGKDARSKSMV